MKTRNLLIISVLLTLAMSACNEETKFGSSITPIKNVTNSLAGTFDFFRDEPTIMSTQFKSSKNGRITEFGIIAGKGTYTVSLWDSSLLNMITSTTITVSDSTIFTYKDITDVNIAPNKVYIISMFNQIAEGGSGAQASKLVASGFPLTIGDITLIGTHYINTSNANAFPAGILYTNIFRGIADFKFESEL